MSAFTVTGFCKILKKLLKTIVIFKRKLLKTPLCKVNGKLLNRIIEIAIYVHVLKYY